MADRIDVEGGYLIDSEYLAGKVFVPQGRWDPKFEEYFTKDDVVGLRLSASAGWPGEPLTFIENLPLKSLEIYHASTKDLSCVQHLSQLRHLGLVCPFSPLDFSHLSNLRFLSVKWRKGVGSALELPELLSFTAEGYPFSDLTSLKGLVKLQHLMVISRKLRSLDGIESLGALVRLILSRCAHVEDLSPLSRHPSLTELELDTCEGITDLGPLAEVMNLRKLLIESSSGRVGSIEPLAELNDLEELYLIGVKVEDSNLRPLLNLRKLKKLGMAVWDGYVPTVGEVRTRLGIS